MATPRTIGLAHVGPNHSGGFPIRHGTNTCTPKRKIRESMTEPLTLNMTGRSIRLPDGGQITKSDPHRSISGLPTLYPCDPRCGCRTVPDNFVPRRIVVDFRFGPTPRTRTRRRIWDVPEHISVERIEAMGIAMARENKKNTWVAWQVLLNEKEWYIPPRERLCYCVMCPPRCTVCGDYQQGGMLFTNGTPLVSEACEHDFPFTCRERLVNRRTKRHFELPDHTPMIVGYPLATQDYEPGYIDTRSPSTPRCC